MGMRPSSTNSHFAEISDVLVGDDINIDLWAYVSSRAVTTLLQLTRRRSDTKCQGLFTQQINAAADCTQETLELLLHRQDCYGSSARDVPNSKQYVKSVNLHDLLNSTS